MMIVSSSTGGQMLIKQEHTRLYRLLGASVFLDVEHFRNPTAGRHVAVCVLKNGACFIGVSQVGKKDHYSRKLGHTVSMGRALRKAVDYYLHEHDMDFMVHPALQGRDLRDECYKELIWRELLFPEVK